MKALLVVDMQNVCVGEKHAKYFKYDNDKLIKEVNQIIEINDKNIVIYIRNKMKKNFINRFLPFQSYDGSKEAELVEKLNVVSDYVFDKYSSDAFTNKKLDVFLNSKNINEIEIVGVDGGACVSLTALGAIKKGYKVTLIQNGIGTMFIRKKNKYFKKLEKQGARFIDIRS